MLPGFEQALGALLVLLILLDVFLTVLYARAGTGIISSRLALLIWRAFGIISRQFGRSRGTMLSFCGPTILVLLAKARSQSPRLTCTRPGLSSAAISAARMLAVLDAACFAGTSHSIGILSSAVLA